MKAELGVDLIEERGGEVCRELAGEQLAVRRRGDRRVPERGPGVDEGAPAGTTEAAEVLGAEPLRMLLPLEVVVPGVGPARRQRVRSSDRWAC
jgi:hypothetical protein